MREAAERRVAQLHSKIQGLESRLHQLTAENRALSAAACPPGAGPSSQVDTFLLPTPALILGGFAPSISCMLNYCCNCAGVFR